MDDNVKGSVTVELVVDAGSANQSIDETKGKVEDTSKALDTLEKKEETVSINSIRLLSQVNALASGVNQVMSSLTTLLPMSDGTRESFVKLSAAIQGLTEVVHIISALKTVTDLYNVSAKRAAVSGVAAAAASNPLLGVAAGVAVGAAIGGVTAYFLTQNVNVAASEVREETVLPGSETDTIYAGGYY